VVTFHADGLILMPFGNRIGSWPFPPLSFIWGGHTGVTLFFVLSAFLLALPFLEEADGGKPVSWRSSPCRWWNHAARMPKAKIGLRPWVSMLCCATE
jgi:peptidoglycan/LPS O-acetylase OafA/YrhL